MKTLFLVLLLFGLLLSALIYRSIYMYGVRYLAREKQYEADYKLIQKLIREKPVTQDSFESIDLRLSNLKRLPFRNQEKTSVLCNEFYKKYGRIRIEKHLNIEKQDK